MTNHEEWLSVRVPVAHKLGKPMRPMRGGAPEAAVEVDRLTDLELSVCKLRGRLTATESVLRDSLRDQRAMHAELETVRTRLAARAAPAPPPRPPPSAPRTPAPKAEPEDAFPDVAAEVEAKLAEIEGRIESADRTVRSLIGTRFAPAPAPPPPRVREPDAAVPPPTPEPEPEPEPEPDRSLPDINRIGFEQLREIGLSVTQAARLLARRDARGSYSSLDQLDDLLDFPRELLDRIKRSVRL